MNELINYLILPWINIDLIKMDMTMIAMIGLFQISKWCQMNDTQIERLFVSQATYSGVSRKKNETVENFVLSIRETYDDIE